MPKALPLVGSVVGGAIGSFIPGVGTAIGASIGGTIGSLGAAALTKPASIAGQVQIRGGGRSGHPVRRYLCGTTRITPEEVFRHVDGDQLRRTHLIASEPINAVTEVWIYGDTHLTPLKADANHDIYDQTKGTEVEEGQSGLPIGNYDDSNFHIAVGRGEQTQLFIFYDDIGDEVPKLENASWNGNSVISTTADFGIPEKAQRRWRGRFPLLEVVAEGGLRYNPTLDTEMDGGSGTHRRDDPDTWEFTRNAAASALHILRDKHGLGKPNSQILIDDWMQAIEDCEDDDLSLTETFDFDSGTVAVRSAGTDPGHAAFAYDRGTVQIAAGQLQAIGTDADGTVTSDETARVGIYFDVTELGIDPTRPYTFEQYHTEGHTVPSGSLQRQIIAEADHGSSASDADQLAYSLPPQTRNISVVSDTGFEASSGATDPGITNMSKRYCSWTGEYGAPNGGTISWDNLVFEFAQDDRVRYAADGLVQVDTRETDLLAGVLKAMGGFLSPSFGQFGVRAGVWHAPTESLSQPIADGFRWTSRSLSAFDAVVVTYFETALDYQETSTRKVLVECDGRRKVDASSYTLVIGDATMHVRMSEAGATVTVPPQSSVAFVQYTKVVIEFVEGGTVAAGAGVTLNADDGLTAAAGEYIRLTLDDPTTDTWLVEITNMERVHPVDQPLVSSGVQATRLAKLEAMRLRHNRTIEGVWTAQEYERRVGDTLTFARPDLPIVDGTYMVVEERDELRSAPGGGMRALKPMHLVEDVEAIYAFDEASEHDPITAPETDAGYTDLDAAFSLTCGQEDDLDPSGVAQAIFWAEATVSGGLSAVKVKFEISRNGGGTYEAWQTLDLDLEALSEGETDVLRVEERPAFWPRDYVVRATLIHADIGTSDPLTCAHTTTEPSAVALQDEAGDGLLDETFFVLLED